jgi:hypothetical protein
MPPDAKKSFEKRFTGKKVALIKLLVANNMRPSRSRSCKAITQQLKDEGHIKTFNEIRELLNTINSLKIIERVENRVNGPVCRDISIRDHVRATILGRQYLRDLLVTLEINTEPPHML